ncbi:unnamed protein product [Brassica rapa subsp. trilocularis]
MAITMKTLITFVFTIFFIVCSVHCGTTATADTPGNGYGEIKQVEQINVPASPELFACNLCRFHKSSRSRVV